MKRTKMVLAVAGLMIAMLVVLAAPAMANDKKNNDNDRNNHHKKNNDVKFVSFDDDFDDIDFRDRRFFFDDDFDDFDFDFDSEQDAESGDVDQSFVVTNTGDNSNQCVGTQGVANTGNAQNQTGITQIGDGFDDDFKIEDSGASIEVSPTNTTTCDQQVNQAAAAYGGAGYYYW